VVGLGLTFACVAFLIAYVAGPAVSAAMRVSESEE